MEIFRDQCLTGGRLRLAPNGDKGDLQRPVPLRGGPGVDLLTADLAAAFRGAGIFFVDVFADDFLFVAVFFGGVSFAAAFAGAFFVAVVFARALAIIALTSAFSSATLNVVADFLSLSSP